MPVAVVPAVFREPLVQAAVLAAEVVRATKAAEEVMPDGTKIPVVAAAAEPLRSSRFLEERSSAVAAVVARVLTISPTTAIHRVRRPFRRSLPVPPARTEATAAHL